MSKRLAVVAAVSLVFASSACTGSRAAIVAGAGTMLLGGMSFAAGAPNNNCTYDRQCDGVDTFFDGIGDDVNEGQRALGAGMMITGGLVLLAGLVANNHDSSDEVEVVATTNVRPPAVDVVFEQSAPTLAAPGMVDRTASPAELAVRARLENRLWLQARIAASRGDCVATVATSKRLVEVDPALHAQLLRDDVDVATCVELAATPGR